MHGLAKVGALLVVIALTTTIAGQDLRKPLDPAKARINYSFAVRPGAEPFRFQVQVDKTSTITGVSVFRSGQSSPFQVLPACRWESDLKMTLDEYDGELELLKHADLNFDGFEDVQLLQNEFPNPWWCTYEWDPKAARFRSSPEIPNPDPVPHPESKTITAHQDWQGGPYKDSTYRWNRGKTELIEQSGVLYGSNNPKCGFTRFCSRLINGKMVTTAEKPFVCDGQSEEEDKAELICPAAPVRTVKTQ